MCGIVGYIGKRDAAPILMEGLHRLEYRGYDSAGIAVARGDELRVAKCKGRVRDLEKLVRRPLQGLARHRAHALGDAWRAQRPQRPPALRHREPHRRRP